MQNEVHFSHRNIKLSRHAEVRAQQRCIPDAVRDLLLDFGVARPAAGGAERYTFDKKSWRAIEKYLGSQAKYFEKYRNIFVILSDDSTVVTEGWVH